VSSKDALAAYFMNEIRRILVACDKFKGSLSAPEACAAIARGLARRWPEAVIETCPIADGGEGFAAALEGPLCGRWVEAPCHDALGRLIRACYLVVESSEGVLAVMEMAAASGMWRISNNERNILRANTLGTGELMRHAVEQTRARRLILGIGGSATNDGGAGMAAALGVRFLDSNGLPLAPSPGIWGGRLARIDVSKRISLPPVMVACDVASPLLGQSGATRVFGPQKGADESSIPILEAALEAMVKAAGGEVAAARPGSGAAGGLGFGLLHFAGASLVSGFDLLAGLTGLAERIAGADLVVTGEGSLDEQTLAGKGPAGVARLARSHGKSVWVFCGRSDPAARDSMAFDRVVDLASTGLPIETLMSDTARLLEEAAAGCC
jgi:glycerate kinase